MGGPTAGRKGQAMNDFVASRLAPDRQVEVIEVGAPGAPTVPPTHGWTEEMKILYDDVALCRLDLAERRPAPTTIDSMIFALTELAEYCEAERLRSNPRYVRNNDRHFDARRELAQTGEMLFTALYMLVREEPTADAGGVLIGRVAYYLGLALVSWGRAKGNATDHALGKAAAAWVDLADHVGEDPQQLIGDELTRIYAKFQASV